MMTVPRHPPATLHLETAERLLVFGGPYSNLAATEAMRAEAIQLGIPPQHTICTGDVIAYAAEPEETARLVMDWGIHVVAGNCEEQLAAGAEDCGCGFEEGSVCDMLSRGWYPFALANTTAKTRNWMAGLPSALNFRFAGRNCHVLHGGSGVTNRFIFASDRDAIAEEVAGLDADIVFAGHAGLPFTASVNGTAWINAGVIGVPANDGTPDGWYALVERIDGNVRVALRRLAYDHTAAAAAMRRSGHANGYARAIVTGIWPSHDILPPDELERTGVRLRQKTLRLPRREPVDA